jgi:predicted acetyltransferase
MTTIKPLPVEDREAFVDLIARAYPGMDLNSDTGRQRMADTLAEMANDPARNPYAAYRDGRLVGGMILYDLEVNVRGQMVPAGGLGSLAVNLLDKRQKIARDMVVFYLDRCRQRSALLSLLYPFRPDFYRAMGFGYGTKISVYEVRTSSFPRHQSPEVLRYLTPDDADVMLTCANRFARCKHGMALRFKWEMERYFKRPGVHVVGCERDGDVSGYLVFDFVAGESFVDNKLRAIELVYEDGQTLAALLSFVQTQADQAHWTIWRTFDDEFHFVLSDPRHHSNQIIAPVYHESNLQGLGLMYKVIDTRGFFAALQDVQFAPLRLRLKVQIYDSMTPENEGSVVVRFSDGEVRLADEREYDLAIALDVAEFSSLVMGAVSFHKLYEYGLVDISSSSYVGMLDELFSAPSNPICLTVI